MEQQRTILFADIAGSTELYEKIGDVAALKAVAACLDHLKAATIANGGRVVKTIGDELMSVFDTAAQATQAANSMQADFGKTNGEKTSLRVRIGLHFGSVIETDGDCFGDTVNLAARLTALAIPDQILTSRPTFDALPPYLQATCRRLYSTAVKGRTERVTIFEALWRQDQDQTMLANNSTLNQGRSKEAKVSYQGKVWIIGDENPQAGMGRDSENTIVVSIATASRHHAKILLRRGQFVIADQSSNGTYVKLQNTQERLLRREELVLTGEALIGLGTSSDNCGDELLVIEIDN